ncbi:hypothetical protein A1G_07320 [Rickettsia rickettsii str. 'Sheila Smith']|uniref:Uncharacterized protein n=1 Tax=Rickettsia rickettsii (strain Sheila Smith) TaxID=392021 RepID=A0A0H3AZR1_RICRS|nr:hypothetical protein A1G_07320 [Rickettsia rickettsii str. 'Sheila Smith']
MKNFLETGKKRANRRAKRKIRAKVR